MSQGFFMNHRIVLSMTLATQVLCLGCSCSDETDGSIDPGQADGASETSTLDATTDSSETEDASRDANQEDGASNVFDASVDRDAQVTQCGSFASGVSPCALAFDHTTNAVWVLGCSQAQVLSFESDGTAIGTTAVAGESANDVDIDIASASFMLGDVSIGAGDLLFINGETGTADIYRLDKSGGAPSEPLVTDFGASHVVGGAYHQARETFFLVQDRQPSQDVANRVAEIDVATGATLSTFALGSEFSVNYGDLDVCQSTGNLFVVSSDEATVAEFTPTGTFVGEYALPEGVSSSAGIDFDDSTGIAWVAATGGTISCLSGLPCPPVQP